jgi:hypothetical protein
MQQSWVARLWRMRNHGGTDNSKMADWAQGYQLTNPKETLKDVKQISRLRRFAPQGRSACFLFSKTHNCKIFVDAYLLNVDRIANSYSIASLHRHWILWLLSKTRSDSNDLFTRRETTLHTRLFSIAKKNFA